MNPIKIALIIWFVIGMIASGYMVDKPRQPMTAGQAVFGMVISAVIILLVLYA